MHIQVCVVYMYSSRPSERMLGHSNACFVAATNPCFRGVFDVSLHIDTPPCKLHTAWGVFDVSPTFLSPHTGDKSRLYAVFKNQPHSQAAPLQPVPKAQVPCTPYRPPDNAGVLYSRTTRPCPCLLGKLLVSRSSACGERPPPPLPPLFLACRMQLSCLFLWLFLRLCAPHPAFRLLPVRYALYRYGVTHRERGLRFLSLRVCTGRYPFDTDCLTLDFRW
jgi:hypothetical protein